MRMRQDRNKQINKSTDNRITPKHQYSSLCPSVILAAWSTCLPIDQLGSATTASMSLAIKPLAHIVRVHSPQAGRPRGRP